MTSSPGFGREFATIIAVSLLLSIIISSPVEQGHTRATTPAYASPTPASFGIAAALGKLTGNTPGRQSLLRLANTTGLNFFIADGDLANGFYYGHEQDWCGDFHAQYPNLVILAGTLDTGHDFLADAIIYDANNTGTYDTGDSLIFNGAGGINGSPVLGSNLLSTQTLLRYNDTNRNGHWNPGEPVVYDDGPTGKMQTQDPVLYGPIPSMGTALSLDPKIKFFDRNANGVYDKPSGNQDFERFAASPSCNSTPPSISGFTYSGINCSPHRLGEPGYTFPTCYGREYYFDCCLPFPQIRIVLIAAGIQNVTGGGVGIGANTWDYQVGDPHYNWLSSVMQNATGAGLLTMVVTADVCITAGNEECGEGFIHRHAFDPTNRQYNLDLQNLIASSTNAFWVGGSDYGYARMKQLTSLGCGFTGTSYSYNVAAIHANLDVCNHFGQQPSSNSYDLSSGVLPVISAAFGLSLRPWNESGEPIIEDLNGNNLYDSGEPVLAWPTTVPNNKPLTGPISNSPDYLHYNDIDNNGVWDPGEPLYLDANHDGNWTPGETILYGPYNIWTEPKLPRNATDFKILDWDGNGRWSQALNGSNTNPHDALLAQKNGGYFSTFMGRNSPCDAYTCGGHGWVQYDLPSTESIVTGTTHFCRDGERPISSYSQCNNSNVYSDSFILYTQPPKALFTYSPSKPNAGQPISFDATTSYATSGSIAKYSWDFGDNQATTGATTVHVFSSQGSFRVSLTVTASNGATGTVIQEVSVALLVTLDCGSLTCSITTSATIANAVCNTNSCQFDASGRTGSSAYANVTYPISALPSGGHATVSYDGVPMPSSQIMTGNSATVFWVYFSFTLYNTARINVILVPPTAGVLTVTVKGPMGLLIQDATAQITGGPAGQDYPMTRTTSSNGSTTFNGLKPGSYIFQVSATGYDSTINTAIVTPGQVTSVSVALTQTASTPSPTPTPAPSPSPSMPADNILSYAAVAAAALVLTIGIFLILKRRIVSRS